MKVQLVYQEKSYEYLGTYVKGKENLKNPKQDDLRILVKNECGNKLLIWLVKGDGFFGNSIVSNPMKYMKKDGDTIKNKHIKYYKIESNSEHLKNMIISHSKGCNVIVINGEVHETKYIQNYKGMYIIDGTYY